MHMTQTYDAIMEFDTLSETWSIADTFNNLYKNLAKGPPVLSAVDVDEYIDHVKGCNNNKRVLAIPSGKIGSGMLIKTFSKFSPYFELRTKVKVNKIIDGYAALWHFTTGINGIRVPALFQYPSPNNRLAVHYLVNGNNRAYNWEIQIGTWYTIQLSQMGRDLELIIDGKIVWTETNYDLFAYEDVVVYQGSPNTYTDGVNNHATPDIDFEYFFYENFPHNRYPYTSTTTTTTTTTTLAPKFLTVDDYSSVYQNDYEKYGPEQALTDISWNSYNWWHSSIGDINPYITFRMLEEYFHFSVTVTDRLDCCPERFKNVEVRVGQTTSFDEAESCGIQSYVAPFFPYYK